MSNEEADYPYQPPISDYGLISDMHSCALVSTTGSVDWCCLPRFDSPAVFSRLVDWEKGGYFAVSPVGVRKTQRRYLPDTNILETTFETDSGVAKLTDFMPVYPNDSKGDSGPEVLSNKQVARILECVSGNIQFTMECYPRFDYGTIIPHSELHGPHYGFAHGGSNAISVFCSARMHEENYGFQSDGTLSEGEHLHVSVAFVEHEFSHDIKVPVDVETERSLAVTADFWRKWASICTYNGAYRDQVIRSALVLKALTFAPSGGFVAAPTTSLPEALGGSRNWDYRYTWIRDTAFGIYALVILGYTEEAKNFEQWLEWSTVGRARDLQIMYGLGGERRLTEVELPRLMGYRRARPVRIGNGAYSQFQLDVYGEILDSAHLFRKFVGDVDKEFWSFLLRVVDYVIDHWREPDEGIWETRGGRQHFIFSKVMCWVALDRAIKAARALNLPGDVDAWKEVRAEIKEEVLKRGYDPDLGAFVQAYGSKRLDASNLMLPLVGFIKATDPRMESTIRAIERELTSPEGFVYRYKDYDDGLGGQEGTFSICTFWLADNLIMLGDVDRARQLFEKLCGYANDVGLLSEQILPGTGEMIGNYPQAFSHLAIINTAVQLDKAKSKGRRE